MFDQMNDMLNDLYNLNNLVCLYINYIQKVKYNKENILMHLENMMQYIVYNLFTHNIDKEDIQ